MRERTGLTSIAKNINVLGAFLAMRDIPELTQEELLKKYGICQADVMALFGGSILSGGDVLAEAMKNKVAKKYVIVGGEGHTTQTLRTKVHDTFPMIETENRPEADVFSEYIKYKYGLSVDFLECKSTNCGNNITYLLDLLRENGISFKSIILSQDASMQRRMDAGFRKYAEDDITIINYAAYEVRVIQKEDGLSFDREIFGMWEMERYISLLIGEIPRLTDDTEGYGPNGKNFIAHVDIPEFVKEAFETLKDKYSLLIRKADPRYAS